MNNTLDPKTAPLGMEINQWYDSLEFLLALASIAHCMGLNPVDANDADIRAYAMQGFAGLLQVGVSSMSEELKILQGYREGNNVEGNGLTSSVNNQVEA